jgi:hypothetical protein
MFNWFHKILFFIKLIVLKVHFSNRPKHLDIDNFSLFNVFWKLIVEDGRWKIIVPYPSNLVQFLLFVQNYFKVMKKYHLEK